MAEKTLHGDTLKNLQPQFFVMGNLATFAERIAPELQDKFGDPLRIADIGSGPGEGTWTLASLLAVKDIRAEIEAIDREENALAHVKTPYYGSLGHLEQVVKGGTTYPDEVLEKFVQINKTQFQVIEELRDWVTPRKLDLEKSELGGEYGAIIMNFVLPGQKPEKQVKIVENALTGLRPGGAFVFEGSVDSEPGIQAFPEELKPMAAAGLHRYCIMEYNPS